MEEDAQDQDNVVATVDGQEADVKLVCVRVKSTMCEWSIILMSRTVYLPFWVMFLFHRYAKPDYSF